MELILVVVGAIVVTAMAGLSFPLLVLPWTLARRPKKSNADAAR